MRKQPIDPEPAHNNRDKEGANCPNPPIPTANPDSGQVTTASRQATQGIYALQSLAGHRFMAKILKWWPVIAGISAALAMLASASIGYMIAQTDRAGLNQRVAYLQARLDGSDKELNALKETSNKELNRNDRLMALVTWALQTGKLTEPEVAPYIDVPKSPVGLDRTIQITFPRAPAPPNFEPTRVDAQLYVRGIIQAPLDGKQIWIVTSLPGLPKVFPQGSWNKDAVMGPAAVNANGRWSSATVSLGPCDRKLRDCHWDIVGTKADANADREFKQYLQAGAPTADGGGGKGFPGMSQLPTGAEEFDRVEVVTANPDYKP